MWSPPSITGRPPEVSSSCSAVVDLLEGGVDVERVARHVTGVDRLDDGVRRDVLRRVVRRPEVPGCLPDRARPEAGSRPEGDAAVERRPDQGDVEAAHLVDAGEAGEGRRAGVPRHLGAVDGPERSVGHVGISGWGKTRGVRSSDRTCSAISPPVASHSPGRPAMVSISVSSARRRPSRPLRNGWMVRVKHEPWRWASVSSPVHSASAFVGVLDDAGPEQVGHEGELLPVVERPRHRDLDDAAGAVAGPLGQLVGEVAVHQAGVVGEPAVEQQLGGGVRRLPHRRAVARPAGRRRPARARRGRGRAPRPPASGSSRRWPRAGSRGGRSRGPRRAPGAAGPGSARRCSPGRRTSPAGRAASAGRGRAACRSAGRTPGATSPRTGAGSPGRR